MIRSFIILYYFFWVLCYFFFFCYVECYDLCNIMINKVLIFYNIFFEVLLIYFCVFRFCLSYWSSFWVIWWSIWLRVWRMICLRFVLFIVGLCVSLWIVWRFLIRNFFSFILCFSCGGLNIVKEIMFSWLVFYVGMLIFFICLFFILEKIIKVLKNL